MRPFCSMMNMRLSPAGCTMASGVLMPDTSGSSLILACASAVPLAIARATADSAAPIVARFICSSRVRFV
jgi:hypothetical protein